MVAMPPVMSANNSERLSFATYGLIMSGDSVCPRKISAATAKLSAPLSRMNFFVTQAKPYTTFCNTPR